MDHPEILAPREVRRGDPGSPYAILSGLGWALNGPLHGDFHLLQTNFINLEDPLQEMVEKFWKIEESPTTTISMSTSDKAVVQLWKENSQMDEGKYMLPIPFKKNPPDLPNNYLMAKHRLDLLGKRMLKNPDLLEKYSRAIHDYIDKGHAVEVAPNHHPEEGLVWYLPHHAVFHPKKPDKIRIVFDCAARFSGVSLNSQIRTICLFI